jgi:hypothetical protein
VVLSALAAGSGDVRAADLVGAARVIKMSEFETPWQWRTKNGEPPG